MLPFFAKVDSTLSTNAREPCTRKSRLQNSSFNPFFQISLLIRAEAIISNPLLSQALRINNRVVDFELPRNTRPHPTPHTRQSFRFSAENLNVSNLSNALALELRQFQNRKTFARPFGRARKSSLQPIQAFRFSAENLKTISGLVVVGG
jgi:hypothetical protein